MLTLNTQLFKSFLKHNGYSLIPLYYTKWGVFPLTHRYHHLWVNWHNKNALFLKLGIPSGIPCKKQDILNFSNWCQALFSNIFNYFCPKISHRTKPKGYLFPKPSKSQRNATYKATEPTVQRHPIHGAGYHHYGTLPTRHSRSNHQQYLPINPMQPCLA